MNSVNFSKSAYSDLNFSFKTSSGDSINLAMYDEKELSTKSYKNKNVSVQEFSLRHSFGYKFSYKGNGIDENDKKEIALAMQKLQPKIDKFMENVKSSGIPSPKEILNKAFEIKQELPKVKDENHKKALQESILNLFDKRMQKHFPNEQVLKGVKELFEALNKQLNSFLLYA